MRVAHLADLHIRLTGQRAEECQRILGWLAEDLLSSRPDAIVIAGDVFDRRSTPEERLYLRGWLRFVTADDCPVAIVSGNHDDPQDLEFFNGITRTTSVYVYPSTGIYETDAGRLGLALLPWPRVANLARHLPTTAGIAERRQAAVESVRHVLLGMAEEHGHRWRATGVPSLLVAHAAVIGASMDSGQPVCGGDEIALGAEDLLAAGTDGVALGHVHARQPIRSGGVPVWYSGAPFRTTFGESTGPKGYLLWTWNRSARGWDVEHRNTPARRMLLLEARLERGEWQGDGCEPDDVPESEVRLRVEYPSEEREAARRHAEDTRRMLTECGAHSVVVEECPVVVQRTRCAEITTARGTAEKLCAWAQATGQEVPASVPPRLAALEEEVQP